MDDHRDVDWGLGDHWRFENYKIGWIKDGEQEHAYKEDNFLWSAIWDDSFFEDYQFELFSRRVKKFGYDDVKKAIFDEVPKVMDLSYIKEYFTASHTMMSLWDDGPQLYILVGGIKK